MILYFGHFYDDYFIESAQMMKFISREKTRRKKAIRGNCNNNSQKNANHYILMILPEKIPERFETLIKYIPDGKNPISLI